VIPIGFGDGAARLDRMHEAQRGLGQSARDEPHFSDRRDVEMRDPIGPERLEKLRRGIGLYGIERTPRKLLREEPSGAGCCLRANKRYRVCRFEGESYPQRAMMLVQLKGPPVDIAKRKLPCGGSPMGQQGCAYMAKGGGCKGPESRNGPAKRSPFVDCFLIEPVRGCRLFLPCARAARATRSDGTATRAAGGQGESAIFAGR